MSMIDMIELTMPWPPRVLLPNVKSHWAVKARAVKQYREACYFQALEQGARGWTEDGLISFHLVFYPPDKRVRDDDGMISAFKHGRDGIADALKINDNRFRTTFDIAPTTGGMVKVVMRGIDA